MIGVCVAAGWFAAHASAVSRTAPVMPGPAGEPGRPSAARQNRACEGCHVEVAAEWRGSQHHTAFTDASFTAAHRREPAAFCRECHAPEADPRRLPPPALARLGVGCVTCHVPGDVVLAAPRTDLAGETAPHPVRRDPRFAGVDACARCHEFAFADGDALMQSTVSEHRASAHAEEPCAACHMPVVGARRRGHTFAASRDPVMLQRALVVAAARDGEQVTLRLAPGAVGHAFPTGDLFRRLRVTVEVVDERGVPQAREVRDLARHFDERGDLVRDDRVGVAGPVELRIDLGPAARGAEIRWRVEHERVAFFSERGAEVEGRTPVAAGVLAAAP